VLGRFGVLEDLELRVWRKGEGSTGSLLAGSEMQAAKGCHTQSIVDFTLEIYVLSAKSIMVSLHCDWRGMQKRKCIQKRR